MEAAQGIGAASVKALTFDIAKKASGWFVNSREMKRPLWGTFNVLDWERDPDGHTVRFRNLARSLIETHRPDYLGYEEPWIDTGTLDYEFSEAQLSLISQLWVLKHDLHVPHIFKVKPNVWQKAVTGCKSPPAELGKNKEARRKWWKRKVMDVCKEHNWFVTTQDEADAAGINIYCLMRVDPVFASREGPLFRRREMQADREAMVK